MNKKLFSMAVLSIILLSGIGVIPVLALPEHAGGAKCFARFGL